MLEIISAPFHLGLETAFLKRVRTLKKKTLAPILVVAPSTRLVERLEQLLAEHRLSVLNIHFHTLSSCAENVVLEQTTLAKPLLSDPLYFDTLVKIILREDKPFDTLAADMAVPDGFPPAVRSSLRDLLDAGIDEKNVEEAMREEFLGKEVDLGTLRSLLRLHHLYLKRLASLPVLSRAALLKQAIDMAPASKWLQGFVEIIFYGFYDMTGNQADFFEAVAKNHPSAFFFPFVKDRPAYDFAKRFQDNFLNRIPSKETVIARSEATSRFDNQNNRRDVPSIIENRRIGTRQSHESMRSPRPPIAGGLAMTKIINVSGLRDEAWFVAAEINRLHQEEKIPFSKIGVIARSQNRLTGILPKTLQDSRIPIRVSVQASFFDLPFVQAAHDLLRRVDEESLITDQRPAVWPEKSTWSDYARRSAELLESLRHEISSPADPWESLLKGVEAMAVFDSLSKPGTTGRREFIETLRERLKRMSRPVAEESQAGVSLLHAEAARGLPFEAVFLIGVEEKVFPRVIREDPFLRDDARLALNQTLGHKIGQKMTALEEERLLFELFTEAASQHLVLTYQRSDDEGSVVGPSSFLRAFVEEQGLSMERDVESLPRQAFEKIRRAAPAGLSRADAITGFLSAGREKDALLIAKKDARPALDLIRGVFAQAALHSFKEPGPFDGQIGPQESKVIFRGGKISPTALEIYGQCPFKYFATRVLELEPKEKVELDQTYAADLRGTSVHEVLEQFYKQLTRDGVSALPDSFPASIFEQVFNAGFGKITAAEVKLHPVLWKAVKTNLKEQLHQALEQDYQECRGSGFRPAYFEAEVATPLEDFSIDETWLGKIDRIDVKEGGVAHSGEARSGEARSGVARVVDYKTGRAMKDRSVPLAALRGFKSQAPLYLMLAQHLFKRVRPEIRRISFVYLYLFDGPQTRVLTPEDWEAFRGAILQTINKQVSLIRSGNFVHVPDDYCSFCEVKPICRQNHSLSTYRARQGVGKEVLDLRDQTLSEKTLQRKLHE